MVWEFSDGKALHTFFRYAILNKQKTGLRPRPALTF